MIDSQKLKTQTSYALKLHDVRKAAAAYELMHSAAAMLQMLPLPVLEALRDYVQEEVKDRKGPLTLCDRSFVNSYAARAYGNTASSTGSQASYQIQMKMRKGAANGACAPRIGLKLDRSSSIGERVHAIGGPIDLHLCRVRTVGHEHRRWALRHRHAENNNGEKGEHQDRGAHIQNTHRPPPD